MTDEKFRELMKESVSKFLEDAPFDEDVWTSFSQCLFYVPGDINKSKIRHYCEKVGRGGGTHQTAGNVLFYLSTQPSYYADVINRLGEQQAQTRQRMAARHHRKAVRS